MYKYQQNRIAGSFIFLMSNIDQQDHCVVRDNLPVRDGTLKLNNS